VGAPVAPVVLGAGAVAFLITASGFSGADEPLPTAAVAKLSTMSAEARNQVIFSMISAERFTPTTCVLDAKLEAMPPPFEFCIRTTMMRSTATMMINTEMKPIFIYFLL
jgi:hypothetical protein